MEKYSKSIRKVLRELHNKAYEREVAQHMEKLWEKFQQWKKGRVSVWDLTALIHEYDYHASRKMYSYYSRRRHDFTVARAIVEGLLKEDEIPPQVLEAIRGQIEGCKSL